MEGYNEVKYTPSRDRQWHIYTLIKNKKDQRLNDQRMFLRTIVRQPSTTNGFLSGSIDTVQASSSFTSNSILRSLMAALEEIELHAHSENVRSGHSHMYLCILREQRLLDLIPFSRSVSTPCFFTQIRFFILFSYDYSLQSCYFVVLGCLMMLIRMKRQHAHF